MFESEVPAFVTGGTGFIGKLLIRELVARGKRVRALVRSVEKARVDLDYNGVELIHGDLDNLEALRIGMAGCDEVYHLAGFAKLWHKDPGIFYRVNVVGLRNILKVAVDTGVRRVVFTSTAGAIGPSIDKPVNEETPRTLPPTTAYEKSKIEAEAQIPEYLDQGLEVVTVNPTRVFGPGELNQSNSVTILIRDYIAGKWKFIPGDGTGIGNYALVNDVVSGHIKAMKQGTVGERYILGGANISYNELFDLLAGISNQKHKLYKVPVSVMMALANFEKLKANVFGMEPLITPGFARKYLYDWETDHSKAVREIGYSTTPFEDAVRSTIDWLEH